jgi:hypothetical protein
VGAGTKGNDYPFVVECSETVAVTGHFKTSHLGSVQNQPLWAAGF